VSGLKQVWKYYIGDTINDLAYSETGHLGVASDNGRAYIFDETGSAIARGRAYFGIKGVSFSNKRFGFVNESGYVYLFSEDGKVISKGLYIGDKYGMAITMTPDGFIACGTRCGYFDYSGKRIWDVPVKAVENGPSYYQGYWYVADWRLGELLIIRDGKIINKIDYIGEPSSVVVDTAICDGYLVVLTLRQLYLYDISNPEGPNLVWKVKGACSASQVTFDPSCKYIAVAGMGGNRLAIYDIDGNLVLDVKYGDRVTSVAWWGRKIAAGVGVHLIVSVF